MALYYRLLFPNQAFRQLDDIEKLVPFMYLSKNEISPNINHLENNLDSDPNLRMTNATHNTIPNNQPIENFVDSLPIEEPHLPSKQNRQKLKSIIHPKQPDSLFWCIYIALNGYNAYIEIGHRYGNTEIEEKQRIMEMMRTSPNKIKDCPKKITKAQYQEIMSDFMTNRKITIEMLIIFVIYYNLRIWIINTSDSDTPEVWYMDIYGNDGLELDPIIIYQYKNKKYSIDLTDGEPKKVLIETIKNTLFRFDNYDKPLKAISNYKNAGLEELADILDIVLNGKYKKQEIYDKIIAKCGGV